MKEIKNVHIVGMGALGMLYGNMILENLGPEHVTYIMDGERYERHKNDIYTINGKPVDFKITKAEDAKPCDLLIVAVKYTGLMDALDTMATSIDDDTLIISVMNGISSEEIIGERYGKHRIVHAVAQGMDAMHFGSTLQYTKSGELHIGAIEPAPKERLEQLIAFFEKACIAYYAEEDINYRMWSKFMINTGLNQTCMVYGTPYGVTLTPESESLMTMISAMREVILLANAEGIRLTEDDLKGYIELVKTFSPDATPSMGQDRINKRYSEVELFAGTVIRLAKKHDIPVPANEFLYRRVHEIESEY